MILPDFIVSSKINQNCKYSGMDCLEQCLDPVLFDNYPHKVQYQYNSRGYRDQEWPADQQLQHSIWCVGDSFTAGIGMSFNHIWPQILEQQLNQRTINVSMDGASNNWIARQTVQILKTIAPKIIIIHWSYAHRREGLNALSNSEKYAFLNHYENIKESSWPNIVEVEQFGLLEAHIQHELLNGHDQHWRNSLTDEELRLWHIRSDITDDINNTIDCIRLVDQFCTTTQVVHSFIPRFIGGQQQDFYQNLITANTVIKEFEKLDYARDGYHYGPLTSQWFVQQLLTVLSAN
jgi:hypothetical protein